MSDLKEIYLQEESFDDEGRSCERPWCQDAEVFENPVRYIRVDIVKDREIKLIGALNNFIQCHQATPEYKGWKVAAGVNGGMNLMKAKELALIVLKELEGAC